MCSQHVSKREVLLINGYVRKHKPSKHSQIKQLVGMYYNHHLNILNDSLLRHLSVQLLTANNYEFTRFIAELISSQKYLNKCYNIYQRITKHNNFNDHTIIIKFLGLLVRCYDVTLYQLQKGEQYIKEPACINQRCKQSVLHLASWLIVTHGNRECDGCCNWKLSKFDFKHNFMSYLVSYIMKHTHLGYTQDLKVIYQPSNLLKPASYYSNSTAMLYALKCQEYDDEYQLKMNKFIQNNSTNSNCTSKAKTLILGYLINKCEANYHINLDPIVSIIFTVSGGEYQSALLLDETSLNLCYNTLEQGFLEFVYRFLNGPQLGVNRFWNKVDQMDVGKIGNRGFWEMLFQLGIQYEQHDKSCKFDVDATKIANYIKHLTVWIIMKFGKPEWNGWYEIELSKDDFRSNLSCYIEAYFQAKGIYNYSKYKVKSNIESDNRWCNMFAKSIKSFSKLKK